MVLHGSLLSYVGPIMYSLWIIQWDFTRRDHLGNPGRVSGPGPVTIGDATTTIAQATTVAGTIAQARATRSQGESSNLQRFKTHHPPTFGGEENLMVVDNWFHQVRKLMEAMEITSDATKIKLASFQLEGES